jgi:GNAT superfamily N-acetyltransferase
MKIVRVIFTPDDVDGIIKLHASCLPHLSWAADKAYVFECILYENLFVMRDGDRVIGSVHYYSEKSKRKYEIVRGYGPRKYLWFNLLCVDKDYRGLGYGKLLIKFVEECACDLGYDVVKLWTGIVPRYLRYYEALGYERFGKIGIDSCGKWQGMRKVIH